MSQGRVRQLPDSAVLLSFGRPDWQSGPYLFEIPIH